MQTMFIDQFSDPSFRSLYQLIENHPEAEGLVKSASIDFDENERRPDAAFAWPDRRLFPIDEPEHAVISKLFIEKQAGVPEEVKERCNRALSIFGITMPMVEKTAATSEPPRTDFLLPSVKRLAVRSPEQVKLASEALLGNLKKLSTRYRAEAATNLIKKAVQFNTPVPTQVLKFAGVTGCDTKVLRDWVEARAEATADPNILLAYEKLAEATRQLPRYCYDRDELIKVAEVLGELDEAAGLTGHYDRRLLDPLETVFNMNKVADDQLELAGVPVSLETLLSVEPEVYRDVFGNDLADEFIENNEVNPDKLKVILPTVPRDLQKTLAAQLGAEA